jgi:hypothetical protein
MATITARARLPFFTMVTLDRVPGQVKNWSMARRVRYAIGKSKVLCGQVQAIIENSIE